MTSEHQGQLEFGAKARHTDPDTSRQAARRFDRSGKGFSQRLRILAYLKLHEGATAGEIAAALGIERHAPSRRLPELETKGFVRKGDARKCSALGSACVTWFVTPRGYDLEAPSS